MSVKEELIILESQLKDARKNNLKSTVKKLEQEIKKKKAKKMDPKEIAWKDPSEVSTICRLFRIKKKHLLARVENFPHKHSRERVYELIMKTVDPATGENYVKHPRKKKTS